MKITTFSKETNHAISLSLLKSILLNYNSEDLHEKLKQIDEFSKNQNIINPIYAIGNLYRAVYILMEQKIYSSVVVKNPIQVFDDLGVKWSPDKSMMFIACGDYLTFYQNHYKWQEFLRQNSYMANFLNERRKKQEQALSNKATQNATYIQGMILENQETFYQDKNFLIFCNELIKTQSPILSEPEIYKIILDILQKNTKNFNEATEDPTFQKENTKILKKIRTYS